MLVSGSSGVTGVGDGSAHTWMTLPVAWSTRTSMPFGCVMITPILPLPRSTVDGLGVGLSVLEVESDAVESELDGELDEASDVDDCGVVESEGLGDVLDDGGGDGVVEGLGDGVIEVEGSDVDVGDVLASTGSVTPTSLVGNVGCADRVTPTIVPAAATAVAAPTAFATIRFMRPIIAGSGDICKMTNLPESIAELARMFVDLRADVHRIEQKLDALPAVFVPREIFAIRQAEHDDLLRRVAELEKDAISKRAVYTLVGVLAALATAIGSILAVVLR